MRLPTTLLFATLTLAACTLSPQQKCQASINRALADNRAEIERSMEAIDRGVVFVPARDNIGVRFCLGDQGTFELCLSQPEGVQTFVKQRIDRTAEQAKLDALLQRRQALQAELAQCAALPDTPQG